MTARLQERLDELKQHGVEVCFCVNEWGWSASLSTDGWSKIGVTAPTFLQVYDQVIKALEPDET